MPLTKAVPCHRCSSRLMWETEQRVRGFWTTKPSSFFGTTRTPIFDSPMPGVASKEGGAGGGGLSHASLEG